MGAAPGALGVIGACDADADAATAPASGDGHRRAAGHQDVDPGALDDDGDRAFSAWLGHADPAFTLRTYVHAQNDALNAAAAILQKVVTRS